MAQSQVKLTAVDPVWERILKEGELIVSKEPLMGSLVHAGVLHHARLEKALSYRLALKLNSGEMSESILRDMADVAHKDDPDLGQAARLDMLAVYERDPACHRLIQPLLFFKGFQAIQAHRIAHWLWNNDRQDMAYHAHSIVIGETAVVGNDVSMLHSVTLGGTGKEDDDRHPKIEDGVLIGAGAKILGNITVGHCSRVAAGSVVLETVPPCKLMQAFPWDLRGSL